jgi:hypothetical protein
LQAARGGKERLCFEVDSHPPRLGRNAWHLRHWAAATKCATRRAKASSGGPYPLFWQGPYEAPPPHGSCSSDTTRRLRTEKTIDDARVRLIRELERLAYSDLRQLVKWGRKAIVNDQGDVTGFEDQVIAASSESLSRDAAAMVKSVTTKSGSLKIEAHDKLGALEKLAKVLGLYQPDAPPPVAPVTIGQMNVVGGANSLDSIRKIGFMLASLAKQGALIEGETVNRRRTLTLPSSRPNPFRCQQN